MLYGVEEAFRFIKEWLRNDATKKGKKSKGRQRKHSQTKKGR